MPKTHLIPMTQAEFDRYIAENVAGYAQEHTKTGKWTADEAYDKAQEQYKELLPQGLQSPNNYLFTIIDQDEQPIGLLWYHINDTTHEKYAFIYDILIYEHARRQGHAQRAFALLEDRLRQENVKSVRLHVFGHNHNAQKLYTKLGYHMTNIHMRKIL
ncbi:MAG TPA: GNAT family N-acetyltransferase [Anaerolineae bacterium]|nr:GNAT family N-acetyltransferase [Anaerolineae bacterium]